jgi:hypothetical protein
MFGLAFATTNSISDGKPCYPNLDRERPMLERNVAPDGEGKREIRNFPRIAV